MQIYLNGTPYTIEATTSLVDLLTQLGLMEKRLALELNQEIIPRSLHASTYLNEGDVIEVIHAIAGG